MRTAKGFLAAYFGLFALAAVGIVGTNLIVDPYWRFDLVTLKGVNTLRTAANSRLGKMGAICRIQPRQAVFGTSRVDVGIDPRHPGFRDLPGPVYNAALAGSGLHELSMSVRHAVHASPRLERVLIGLDFLMFNAHREVAAYGTEVLDYDEKRLMLSPDDTCLRNFMYDADRLLGMGALRSSIGTVRDQIAKPTPGAVEKLATWIAAPDEGGFRRNFKIIGQTLAKMGGYRALFGDSQEEYYVSKIWRPAPTHRYCFAREGSTSTIDVFRELVSFLRASGIDARFFINPVHARMLIALREGGLWPQYEAWKRALVAVLAEDARKSGKPQLPLWDFSGFNTVTMEHVPARDDKTTLVKWFWEPSHYKSDTGNLILDRVLSHREPGRNVPDDFGVALTPKTIEPWTEATRRGVEIYSRREPQEVDLVRSVVNEAMADAEGANCGDDVIALREGAAAVAHGKPAAAEAAFDRAIKLHEADEKLYQALGAPYRERGFEQVLAEARKGVGGEPPLASWVAYQTRGLEREKTGDYLGAARDFGAAIRAGPTNTALHFLRGNALLKAEKPAEAAMEFEKGLKIEPGNATLRQLLQQARASIGWHGSTASTDKNPNPQ